MKQVSPLLFTFGLSTECLRDGSTLSRIFINHSMPPSTHPSIHPSIGSGKTLTLLRFWGCSHITTTWCCRSRHIPDIPPNFYVWKFVGTRERTKTGKEVRKNSCQRREEWKETNWYLRNVERREDQRNCFEEVREWVGERMWGKQRRGDRGKGRRRWRNVRGESGGS